MSQSETRVVSESLLNAITFVTPWALIIATFSKTCSHSGILVAAPRGSTDALSGFQPDLYTLLKKM